MMQEFMSGVVALGTDHAGFKLKEAIKQYLIQHDIPVEDFGCDSESSVDYPDIAFQVAEAVEKGQFEQAILVCGSGVGMAIAANRFPNVRAVVCYDTHTAEMSRRHNNANVLCLGGRVIAAEYAQSIIEVFTSTPFDGGRHTGRVQKLSHQAKQAGSAC